MFCNHCGAQIQDNARFCPFCHAVCGEQPPQPQPLQQPQGREVYQPIGQPINPPQYAAGVPQGNRGTPPPPKQKQNAGGPSTGLIIGIAVGAVVLVGLIVGGIILGTALFGNKKVTATETTGQTTEFTTAAQTTTTEPEPEPTTQIVRPFRAPVGKDFLLYIDETNKAAWSIVSWESVSGEFDGYQIQFGFRADGYYDGQPEEWNTGYVTVNASQTSYRTDLVYASDAGCDMARVRTYYMDEDGRTVYGDWSERIYLDFENKVFL